MPVKESRIMNRSYYMEYLLLGIAIVFEILASSMLQSSAGFTKLGPSLACILFYSICFYAFSKALLKINLSIAYASWCAIGIVATTIISICIFNQKMSAVGFLGIVLIIIGCVLLNLYGNPHG